jgi:hypothetical protein
VNNRNLPIDEIIVSADLSKQFLNFWPIVARSWETLFDIKVTLVLVAKKDPDLQIIKQLEKFGNVEIYKTRLNAPMANLGKMARWYYASTRGKSVVSIEDIDTIFLKSEYLINRLEGFHNSSILGIGSDVNQDTPEYAGKFPVSNVTGEGKLFRKLLELNDYSSFDEFVSQFKGRKIFDYREDPFNSPRNFSDESLIRSVRSNLLPEEIKVIPRNVEIGREWMDRSWWPSDGEISDNFLLVNFPRPLYNNRNACRNILDLYFPDGYPWIYKRSSSMFTNPDSLLRRRMYSYWMEIRKRVSSIGRLPFLSSTNDV